MANIFVNLNKALIRLFGSRNQRVLKEKWPVVHRINALEKELMALPDEKLSGRTAELRDRLAHGETLDGILPDAFASVREATPSHVVAFTCDPAPEPELLVELLEEVIYVVDAQDVIPVEVAVSRTAEGGLVGEFGVVDRSTVETLGPAPKAVTRHGLRFEHTDSLWHCQAIVDV